MIIKTRRKNESILKRIVRRASAKVSPPVAFVLTQELFETELIKEAFRSNRRGTDREFALITFDFSDYQATDRKLAALIAGFRSRLRVSDVVGWFDFQLAVLLPETKKQGAMLVANQLSAISLEQGVKVDTHVAIYPWDDTLVAVTSSLSGTDGLDAPVVRPPNEHRDDDDNGDGSNDPPSGNHSSENSNYFDRPSENFERTDRPHSSSSSFESHLNFGQASAVLSPSDQVNEVCDWKQELSIDSSHVSSSVPSPKQEIQGTGKPFQVLSDRTPKWKRGLDILGAGTGLILLSPLFLFAAAAIKLNSAGPVFFVQKREGKDGQVFGILKFRTMKVNAEAEQALLREQSEQDGPAFKLTNDPRVTFVGKYLRKSCIDELPQLYNILIGEMSLVGPRPLPIGESKQCSTWQRQRLSILPGLTCIWQAHGGRDIKFSEWMRMDMEYIRKRSLTYDLKLIFETAFLAVLHRGSV